MSVLVHIICVQYADVDRCRRLNEILNEAKRQKSQTDKSPAKVYNTGETIPAECMASVLVVCETQVFRKELVKKSCV